MTWCAGYVCSVDSTQETFARSWGLYGSHSEIRATVVDLTGHNSIRREAFGSLGGDGRSNYPMCGRLRSDVMWLVHVVVVMVYSTLV